MTQDEALWNREDGFWAAARARIDDRKLCREGQLAVLTYRVTGRHGPVRVTSTYTRAGGGWMLVEHRQSH